LDEKFNVGIWNWNWIRLCCFIRIFVYAVSIISVGVELYLSNFRVTFAVINLMRLCLCLFGGFISPGDSFENRLTRSQNDQAKLVCG
jgi:hypothetical protein